MRFGVIDRVETDGELVQAFVSVDGDIEGPCPVAAPLGTQPEVLSGAPCLLFPISTANGEYGAILMEWVRSTATRDFLALFADVQSLKSSLQSHGHISAAAGVPTGPAIELTPPNDPVNPTITGSDRFKVTHE